MSKGDAMFGCFVRATQVMPRLKAAVHTGAFALSALSMAASLAVLAGCTAQDTGQVESESVSQMESTVVLEDAVVMDKEMPESVETDDEASEAPADEAAAPEADPSAEATASSASDESAEARADVEALRAELGIVEDYRAAFSHGPKGAAFQRYIVLHDTESNADPQSIVSYWDGAGTGVAAHFVVGTDGTVVQCVPLDEIAHHAGYGDTGHNSLYGLVEDGRDDMAGSSPIGSWASDYGMNAYSVGIEMVHVGGSGPYPEAQLAAVDKLIAYIDAYYGFESTIIDHKAWRTGNSDTSAEFAAYLANYQSRRAHE